MPFYQNPLAPILPALRRGATLGEIRASAQGMTRAQDPD